MKFYLYICYIFALVLKCYEGKRNEEFEEFVLNEFERLEKKIAHQEAIITRQQNVIEKLTSLMVSKEEESFKKRFVLNSVEGPIGFTAAIKHGTIDHAGRNQTIVFESFVTDIGGGYDNSTGVFIAPLSGIYLFSCSLLDGVDNTHGGVKLHADIVQNDRVLGRVFAHADDTYRDQGAQTVITKVSMGDRIFVRVVHNNDVSIGGQMFSTFSGYMLEQM